MLSELPVVALGDERQQRRLWRTTSLTPYRLRSGEILTIPQGFTTDFTSMPRSLWAIEPPTGRAMFAALPHDFLYAAMLKPRAEADLIFLHEMEDAGITWLKRLAMYRGVRTFGAGGYGRPEEHAQAMALLEAERTEPARMAAAFASLGHCEAP
jgi:hypothetical protein